MRWLVSGDQDQLNAITDAGTSPTVSAPSLPDDDVVIFQGLDSGGNLETNENGTYGSNSVIVPRVEVATTTGNSSYYAYWVEDEGGKDGPGLERDNGSQQQRCGRRTCPGAAAECDGCSQLLVNGLRRFRPLQRS